MINTTVAHYKITSKLGAEGRQRRIHCDEKKGGGPIDRLAISHDDSKRVGTTERDSISEGLRARSQSDPFGDPLQTLIR